MKKCLYCDKEIIYKTKANNVKYCSVEHRELHYREQGRLQLAQTKYRDKKHENPFRGARQCQYCNLWYRAVCHHAWQIHGVSEREYKEDLGLDHKKGLIPKELKEIKAEHVFENGTVLNLKRGVKTRFKSGDSSVGKYKRSPETMERLRKLHSIRRA